MTLAEWAARIQSDLTGDYRRVAQASIGEMLVSTVWLGLDHGWGQRPLYFETMIFGGKHDGWQARYSTRAEAEAGHAALIARLEAGLEPDEG